jgi:hypothetical protein
MEGRGGMIKVDDVQTHSGIYILTGTLSGKQYTKVGKTTAGVRQRIGQLNGSQYAGISDWKLETWFALDQPRLVSAVEKIAHDELEIYNTPLSNGTGGTATEVFDICPREAEDKLNEALFSINGYVNLESTLIGGKDVSGSSVTLSQSQPSMRRNTNDVIRLVVIAIILGAAALGLANVGATS